MKRALTMAELDGLLKGKSNYGQVAILLAQKNHWLKGCGLGGTYSFEVRLFSSGYNTS